MIYVGKSFLHMELPGGVKIYHSTLRYHELRILAFFIEKQEGSSFSKYQAISGDMTGKYVSFTPKLYKMDPEQFSMEWGEITPLSRLISPAYPF